MASQDATTNASAKTTDSTRTTTIGARDTDGGADEIALSGGDTSAILGDGAPVDGGGGVGWGVGWGVVGRTTAA
jgi:hypothetical protein